MTVKEFLEKQAKYFREASYEYPDAHHKHQYYKGNAVAYEMMLKDMPTKALKMHMYDEVLE